MLIEVICLQICDFISFTILQGFFHKISVNTIRDTYVNLKQGLNLWKINMFYSYKSVIQSTCTVNSLLRWALLKTFCIYIFSLIWGKSSNILNIYGIFLITRMIGNIFIVRSSDRVTKKEPLNIKTKFHIGCNFGNNCEARKLITRNMAVDECWQIVDGPFF